MKKTDNSKKPAKNTVLLELHVPDFEKTKEYYLKLGFKVIWERRPEGFKGYLILKLEGNILCFWCGNEKVYEHPIFKKYPRTTQRGYGVEIVIMVEDIERYYKEVKGIANVVEPLQLRPWGLKDFRTEDPFGYYLRFTSHHNILGDENAVK